MNALAEKQYKPEEAQTSAETFFPSGPAQINAWLLLPTPQYPQPGLSWPTDLCRRSWSNWVRSASSWQCDQTPANWVVCLAHAHASWSSVGYLTLS